ncbi:MAG TPA: ABC transporter permease [Egicoccus sp.]|nr:ABC transporter permease [Egicoccus sp.]HSK24331.1 ABC transporter permease [Egicoccus sp.]
MFLALRELRRAPWRFGLLAAAVGLLVYLVLFMQAILGSLTGAITGALEHQDAPVLVYAATARGQLDASVLDPAMVDEIAQQPGVAAAAPLSVRTYSARAAAEDLIDVAVFGHDPDGPGAPATLIEGSTPGGPDEAIASAADVDDGFGLGDRVVIEPGGREIEVVGLAEDLNYSVQPSLFVDLETFEALAAERAAQAPFVPINAVAVAPEDGVSPTELVGSLGGALADVEVLTRDAAVAGIPGIDAIEQSFALILGLAFAVIGLVTGIFFLILTVQKRQTLTLLRAVGAAPRDVVVPLLVQVLLLTGGGVLIGVGLLAVSAGAVPGELGIELQPPLVAATGAGIVVLGLLAALAAVRRVLRIDPAAALDTNATGVSL